MIAVVAGLRRQIEGDRQSGLSLAQIFSIKRVRRRGGRMPGIGAKDPRFIAQWFVAGCLVAHWGSNDSGVANVARNLLQRNMRVARPRSKRSAPRRGRPASWRRES